MTYRLWMHLASLSILLLCSTQVWASPITVLMLGDSLTEGYGVSTEQAYPHLVEQQLKSEGHDVKVISAGVSGATSASGPPRLKWYLKAKPDILVLALGANDGLRGISINSLEKNLSTTIEMAQKNNMLILLAGMRMLPNYGPKYTKEFAELYPKLAKKYKLDLIPFLLDGVAAQPQYNLPDRIHPNEKGHKILANTVTQYLKPLLKKSLTHF